MWPRQIVKLTNNPFDKLFSLDKLLCCETGECPLCWLKQGTVCTSIVKTPFRYQGETIFLVTYTVLKYVVNNNCYREPICYLCRRLPTVMLGGKNCRLYIYSSSLNIGQAVQGIVIFERYTIRTTFSSVIFTYLLPNAYYVNSCWMITVTCLCTCVPWLSLVKFSQEPFLVTFGKDDILPLYLRSLKHLSCRA